MVFLQGFLQVDGKEYYINNEIMVIGWFEINGEWFCFDETGAMKKKTWVGQYYLKEDGDMCVNCHMTIDGIAYNFDENGIGVKEDKISNLSFTDELSISIDDDRFYPNGYVESDFPIESITYSYVTPNLYYDIPYQGFVDVSLLDDPYSYDFSNLTEEINNLAFDCVYEYDGGYILDITVSDCSQKAVYGNLYWEYYK